MLRSGKSFTLLHLAAYFGFVNLAKKFLKGARNILQVRFRVSKRDNMKRVPLFYAVEKGNVMITKLLLDKGANIHEMAVTDPLLLTASRNGDEAIVGLLLENGAGVNVGGGSDKTALKEASSHGHEAIVRLLLEKGAHVHAKAWTGQTALTEASSGGHEAIVQLLLENDAHDDSIM